MHSDVMNKLLSFSDAFKAATVEEIGQGGIGTLGEKTLHRTLKYYFEPDSTKHEISYLGHVADILNDDGIIEIQTRSLGRLVPKLEDFLPSQKVTVVYPIVENKKICRIDTVSGETLSLRKSPKKGRATDALPELSLIRKFIPNDNLSVLIVFVDAIESRMNNQTKKIGRKRTQKIDLIPTGINSFLPLKNSEDYFALLPNNLPPEFTKAEFEKITGFLGIDSHGALMLMLKLGILTREKNGGRSYLYKLNKTV